MLLEFVSTLKLRIHEHVLLLSLVKCSGFLIFLECNERRSSTVYTFTIPK
jgi:hypothetical protein